MQKNFTRKWKAINCRHYHPKERNVFALQPNTENMVRQVFIITCRLLEVRVREDFSVF